MAVCGGCQETIEERPTADGDGVRMVDPNGAPHVCGSRYATDAEVKAALAHVLARPGFVEMLKRLA